jgi:membrane protease YdiL (CAAX protease family)
MNAVPTVAAVVAAPITEEIVFRLFVMGVVSWLVYRITKRAKLAFLSALIASALIFAAPHLIRPLPEHQMLANYYRWALLAKYTALGVPLGWIFWRWGLPFAILCHAAANATHLLLQWHVF